MKLVFSGHAFERMFQRGVEPHDVRSVIDHGETIENYPSDQPFPSCLMLGAVGGRAIHVAVALDTLSDTAYVVTAYVPEPSLWEPDFKRRRPR